MTLTPIPNVAENQIRAAFSGKNDRIRALEKENQELKELIASYEYALNKEFES